MLRLALGLLGVVGVATLCQSTALAQATNPMDRFKPFVGKWHVKQTLKLFPTAPAEESELTSNIYFLQGNKILVVDETSADGRFRFIGFHSYDSSGQKYLNWGASSAADVGWAEGEFDSNGTAVTYIDRLIEVAGSGPLTVGRGVWRMEGPDRHEYTWLIPGPDGKDFVGKRDVYTRVP